MKNEPLDLAAQAVSLAKKAGANDAMAEISDDANTEFVYRDGRIEQVEQSSSLRLSLQVYADGRYSSHQTTDLGSDALSRFVADAVVLTRHLAEDPHRVIPDPALYDNRPMVDLDLVDASVRDLPREVCLDWLKTMDGVTHTHDQVISATENVWYGWKTSARVSSNGFSGSDTRTWLGYGAEVTLKEGEHGRPEASRSVRGRYLSDLPDVAQVAQEALDRALGRLGSRKASSARAVMVVDPEAGGRLMGPIFGALQARAVQQNRSVLADRRGARIADDVLTVVDDPLLVRGMGSRHYDEEGISARRMPVIEDGVLQTFYVDTYYGRKLGWEPTTGSVSNLTFAPGDKDLGGLIADVTDGFYVTSWLGGNADPTTGDFSFGFRGHQIAQGLLAGPVSEMNITGNFMDLLESLVAVGNDPNPYSSMRTPTLVFENVEFSGK